MSYAFETKDREKSIKFEVSFKYGEFKELKKGTKFNYKGKEVTCESIRSVDIGVNFVKVIGKCR